MSTPQDMKKMMKLFESEDAPGVFNVPSPLHFIAMSYEDIEQLIANSTHDDDPHVGSYLTLTQEDVAMGIVIHQQDLESFEEMIAELRGSSDDDSGQGSISHMPDNSDYDPELER